jgi:acyl-CoA synthetase (AMP-forming)/AMP-acid ligase II
VWIANHAEDEVMCFDMTFLPIAQQIHARCTSVKHWVALCDTDKLPADSGIPGLISYETWMSQQSTDYEWPMLDENAASCMCYTSGTTGNPKAALYSHRSTVLHAYACALPDVMCLSARDTILPVVPMFHVNAWGIPYSAAIAGAKLVFPGYHAASAQHRETRRMMDDLVRAAGQPLDCVEYLPRYTGGEAPGIFRRGHVLLHTQPNDNCPHLVVEAMACGVPIVHQDNGGTPQMVTPLAGVAVPSATSWDKLDYPAPEAFADGLEKVLRDWPAYHRQSRARAIEFMSLDAFLREHRRVFETVCPHLKGSSS